MNMEKSPFLVCLLVLCVNNVHCQLSCPLGLTNSSSLLLVLGSTCYHFVPRDIPRAEAASICTLKGGSLAIIRNNSTQIALYNHAMRLAEEDIVSTRYWLGGSLTTDNTLRWDNSEDNSFSNLAANERYRSSRSCVMLAIDNGTGEWMTADCNRALWFYGYICQYRTVSTGVVSRRANGGINSANSKERSILHLVFNIFSVLLLQKLGKISFKF